MMATNTAYAAATNQGLAIGTLAWQAYAEKYDATHQAVVQVPNSGGANVVQVSSPTNPASSAAISVSYGLPKVPTPTLTKNAVIAKTIDELEAASVKGPVPTTQSTIPPLTPIQQLQSSQALITGQSVEQVSSQYSAAVQATKGPIPGATSAAVPLGIITTSAAPEPQPPAGSTTPAVPVVAETSMMEKYGIYIVAGGVAVLLFFLLR